MISSVRPVTAATAALTYCQRSSRPGRARIASCASLIAAEAPLAMSPSVRATSGFLQPSGPSPGPHGGSEA